VKPAKRPTLTQALVSQGFGTRRDCEGLVGLGLVELDGVRLDDPYEEVDVEGRTFTVDGKRWPFREKAIIALNKPAHTECSKKPKHHPSVYALLPAPLLRRDVQSIGRLDEDSTGLLLFTDDGQLLHRWTSPKHHVPKVYDVGCKHPVSDEQLARLLAGVVLLDDPKPVAALAAEHWDGAPAGLHGVRLTLAEGKYHQVKRMMAAVSNRVESLHRSRFGAFALPADLPVGAWCWVDGPEAIVPPAAAVR
jgi:16S rRNA pseudouridine516 synthase